MRKTGCIGLILMAVAVTAWADAGDPPSRVARLNLLLGQVSFRPGSVEEWTPATLNYPLTTGDHLWTEAGSNAELHVGSAAIRMDGQTALAILNLDDRIVQLSVTGGTVNIHLRYLGEDESFEVDTPNVAISLLRAGDYRISADGDRNSTFAVVRAGEAEITGAGAAFPVRSSESATLTGIDPVGQELGPAPPFDGFDQWCSDRDRRTASMVSARYVPPEMIGAEDLDRYGVWREMPPYGVVWVPTGMPGSWAPYRYGHWAWIDPWGWTWIDDAPWGFAPFHYGRWAFVAGTWVWAPGRMMVGVRPVYAPALVAFVGGPRFGVGVGIGGGAAMAAWFPLGPGEVYRPGYHVSDMYVRNVNVVHVTNVTVINNGNGRYMNQNVAGAVTAVPPGAFASGRPVAMAAVPVRPGMMADARVVETAGVPPTREAVLGHAGSSPAHAPPARFVDRAVVARNAPPPPPVSFGAKEQALRANGGRPLDPAAERNFRPAGQSVHPMVRTVGGSGAPGAPAQGETPRPGFAPRPAGDNPATTRPMRNDRPPGSRQYGQPGTPNTPPQGGERQQPAMQSHPATPAPTATQPRPAQETAPRSPEAQRPAQPAQGSAEHPQNNDRPAGHGQQHRKETKKTEKERQ